MASPVFELTCELIRRASVTPDDAGCQSLIAEDGGNPQATPAAAPANLMRFRW